MSSLSASIAILSITLWPPWAVMWFVILLVYATLKAVTLTAVVAGNLTNRETWAYIFVWPGLNAPRFLSLDVRVAPALPRAGEWLRGILNAFAGVILFWNAGKWLGPSHLLLLGWAGMVGTILTLHFGAFQLVSCIWRSAGVDAEPLMNRPLCATSVAAFWGRRWNTAYRDFTYQFLFRPLATRFGATTAVIIGFVASGLVHELVISVPARGGYGGPLAYFCVQAASFFFERSTIGQRLGLGRGWRGWLFAALVLLLPVRPLFHEPFMYRVVLPFMQAMGAA